VSYSISVRAATKAEAKKQTQDRFNEVVRNQPVHEKDRAAVEALAANFIDLLDDTPPEGQVFCVAMSGSIVYTADEKTKNVNVSCSAGFGPST
jgi:hypothetical protein